MATTASWRHINIGSPGADNRGADVLLVGAHFGHRSNIPAMALLHGLVRRLSLAQRFDRAPARASAFRRSNFAVMVKC